MCSGATSRRSGKQPGDWQPATGRRWSPSWENVPSCWFGTLSCCCNVMLLPSGKTPPVRTDAGYLMVPAEDPALLVSVVESRGRLEPGTLGIVLSLLPEGGLLVDVGAMSGLLPCLLRAKWGRAAR